MPFWIPNVRALALTGIALASTCSTLIACARGKDDSPADSNVTILQCDPHADGTGCSCFGTPDGSGNRAACGPTEFVGGACCADPDWPTRGSCSCKPGPRLVCTALPGACVCAPTVAPSTPLDVDACYPGAMSNSGAPRTALSSFGECCMMDGLCACFAFPLCPKGAKRVDECSAATMPGPSPCPEESIAVARCSDGPEPGGTPPPENPADAGHVPLEP